jgi:protein lifeguard
LDYYLFVRFVNHVVFILLIEHYSQAEAVIMAVGITTAVCLGLTIFALQTKWDFTILRGLMLCLLISLIFFGILAGAMSYRTADVAYAWLGAAIFSVYLVIDTQLLMGGNHRYAITPEEYIFAALNLYMDIINLFLMVLRLVGRNH